MKTMSKKLMSIATTVAVSASILSSFVSVNAATVNEENIVEKATAAETAGIYSTNGKGFGKKKTISIDGDFSDWSEDMLIAQGAACDTATRFKGVWENWVMDSYSLYGAWDDENLYVAWQNVNTYDTFWEQDGNGPLSDKGKCGDAPVFIAIDTGKGNAMTGRMQDGKGIWGVDVEFQTRVDNILAIHSDLTGTPGLFKADSSGASSYAAADGLLFDFKGQGIEVKVIDDCFPSEIMGVWNPGDENDKASYDLSSNWVDLKTTTLGVRPHNTKYDTFYEMKIPFSALGITKEDVESNGVGVMQVISRGESGMDCVPHDPSMLDNTYGNYSAEPSNSHEKDDKDIITVPLAKVGNGGGVTPPPVTKGTVNVKYVDEDGNEIATSKTMTGNVGDSYTTSAVSVSGYTLKTTPSNASGTYKSGTTTVTYVYSKNSVVDKGTVNVKYVDEDGNEIASSITKTGEVGTSYTTSAKTISGYTLKTTPSNASGTYKNGTVIVTYSYTKASTIVAPIVNSFTTDKQSPQVSGTQVKLTANATGTGTLQYKFLVKDAAGNWAVLRDYATSNTYTWTTKATGNKTLYVDVKDSNGQVTRKSMSYTVKEVEKPVVSTFIADKKSPQASGTQVTLSAAASGTGVLQYKFLVKDESGNWFVIRDYSILNSCTWKANKVGNKTLYVDVKDSNGQVTRKSMSYTVKAVPPTVSSFTADKQSPQASGTQVKLTAKATGTGTLQYKFLIKDAAGNWAVLRNYGTSNTYTWTTKATGNKTLYVDVKDSNGQVTRKSMNYVVNANLVQDSNSAISYTGTWKVATSTRHSGGTCKYASSTAAATYKFTGTGIKLIAPKASDRGIAKVTVDSKVYYVDLYSASAKDQSVVFSLSGLTSGTHTIKVEWTGLKNSSSTKTTITLDAFEIVK